MCLSIITLGTDKLYLISTLELRMSAFLMYSQQFWDDPLLFFLIACDVFLMCIMSEIHVQETDSLKCPSNHQTSRVKCLALARAQIFSCVLLYIAYVEEINYVMLC